ncbi:hypothetical protein C8R42DRAFT_6401 [Lentinula raphanica]|nr:hypothetical protein C8R42DRAFT_6401 [Lentinula raphanica]
MIFLEPSMVVSRLHLHSISNPLFRRDPNRNDPLFLSYESSPAPVHYHIYLSSVLNLYLYRILLHNPRPILLFVLLALHGLAIGTEYGLTTYVTKYDGAIHILSFPSRFFVTYKLCVVGTGNGTNGHSCHSSVFCS